MIFRPDVARLIVRGGKTATRVPVRPGGGRAPLRIGHSYAVQPGPGRAALARVKKAHYAAAIPMFVCIVAVVLLNALGYKETKKNAVNPYWGIGGAMVGASAIIGIAARFVDWDYWVVIESS